jgi:hypothetical protein
MTSSPGAQFRSYAYKTMLADSFISRNYPEINKKAAQQILRAAIKLFDTQVKGGLKIYPSDKDVYIEAVNELARPMMTVQKEDSPMVDAKAPAATIGKKRAQSRSPPQANSAERRPVKRAIRPKAMAAASAPTRRQIDLEARRALEQINHQESLRRIGLSQGRKQERRRERGEVVAEFAEKLKQPAQEHMSTSSSSGRPRPMSDSKINALKRLAEIRKEQEERNITEMQHRQVEDLAKALAQHAEYQKAYERRTKEKKVKVKKETRRELANINELLSKF